MKETPSSILFAEMNEKWQREYLAQKLGQGLLFENANAHDLGKTYKGVSVLSPFVNSRVGKKEMDLFPDLRLIVTRSTGFDHIDLKTASERGIKVCNVPTYGENTVAEHTFALILSLARNLRKSYFKVRDHNFSLDGLMGFDLYGKTIGVVGTGHIGIHVIRMAKGFGMNVLAFDVRQNRFLAEVLGYQYVALEELLSQSDIISLHVPYMKATHHLINQANMSKIKRGAILVNTARGGLVETAALVRGLDEGVLSGAGLDVLEGEELILEEKRFLDTGDADKMQLTLRNQELLRRDNVIYTPHMAFYSKEAVTRILDTTVENILKFMAGNPENVVNR